MRGIIVVLAAMAVLAPVAEAGAPTRETGGFEVSFPDDTCGFTVINTLVVEDEITLYFDRTGANTRLVWHRQGTSVYENPDNGKTLSGTLRRNFNRVIDTEPTDNGDGTFTYVDSDRGIRNAETLRGVGTVYRQLGKTDVFFVADADGNVIDKGIVSSVGVSDSGLSAKACAALAG